MRYRGGKPLIYLYPEQPTKINVSLELTRNMTSLNPKPKQIETGDNKKEKYEWEVESNNNSRIKYEGKIFNPIFFKGKKKGINFSFIFKGKKKE